MSNRKLSRRKLEKMVPDFVEAITEAHSFAMAMLAESQATLNRAAVDRFTAVLNQYGEYLYTEAGIILESGISLPKFVRFIQTQDGKWTVDEVLTASPAFGFDSLKAVSAEVWSLSATVSQPAVSAYFVTAPETMTSPSMVFSVFGDEAGNGAIGFSVDARVQWASLESGPAAIMLRDLIEKPATLKTNFFQEAAVRLHSQIAERKDGFDVPALKGWLQTEMRELGDLEVRSTTRLFSILLNVIESLRADAETALTEQATERNGAYEKQIKQLSAKLEKAEMFTKGSQDRAARLEGELRNLRSRMRVAGDGALKLLEPQVREGKSVRQALDLLF